MREAWKVVGDVHDLRLRAKEVKMFGAAKENGLRLICDFILGTAMRCWGEDVRGLIAMYWLTGSFS